VGYLADLLKACFQNGSRWGVEIDYSYESQPLGTAGPLSLMEGLEEVSGWPSGMVQKTSNNDAEGTAGNFYGRRSRWI